MRRLLKWGLVLSLLGLWLALEIRDRAPPTKAERISAQFALCGAGPARHCVSDGDSFRIDRRRIRVRGIDAPEIGENARCAAERLRAEAARLALRDWLNAGPFVLTATDGDERERYGRELRNVRRDGADAGRHLISRDLARPYRGRKERWC